MCQWDKKSIIILRNAYKYTSNLINKLILWVLVYLGIYLDIYDMFYIIEGKKWEK